MIYEGVDKFEYKVQKISFRSLEKTLNELGSDGWELIMIDEDNYIFKRKVTEILINE
jgi:hypothetical protein